MDADRWTLIQTLFEAALERPPSERERYLETACSEDPDLLAEVRSLLAADADLHPLLDSVGLNAVALPADLFPVGSVPSEDARIGPYRIEKLLGQGGMGAVFLASRADGQFDQQVALKLIRGGATVPDQILQRFRGERQILARLHHPNIARLLDGGLADSGQPYFAMEYVEGIPLDRYCDTHDCSTEKRLRLVLAVCEAVQYAHHRLIVHRDLKPSNILVGSDGTVKLLDFGIAKVLAGDGTTTDPGLTRTGHAALTPAYAAPEQFQQAPVTTATDVYALGVVLYELLAGQRPFDLKGASPADIERIVRTQDPAPPSAIAPPMRQRSLRGDLDTICLKALRKEPERRYASAEQLADDLRRYLDGRPVEARADTVTYRARKFVQRHRTGVVATTAAVLLIAALVSFYTVQLAQERDRARLEAETATQVSAFLQDVFRSSDPSEAMGDTVSVRTVLERGAERIDADLAEQPDVQAELLDVMGGVYLTLGQYEKAEEFLARSLDQRRQLYGEEHADVATSLDHMALLYEKTGDYEEAEALNRQALTLRRSLHGEEHEAVAESLNRLAGLLMNKGDYEAAEPLYRQALALRQRLLGDTHPEVATTLGDLALLLRYKGQFEEAEQYLRRGMEVQQRLYGDKPHPNKVSSLSILGAIQRRQEDYEAAEATFRDALAMSRTLYGEEPHPLVATSLDNLSDIYRLRGDYEAAEPLLREAHAIDRQVHGNDHPNVASGLHSLALLLEDLGQYDEAEQHFRETLRILRAVVGDDHPYVAVTMNNFGLLLLRQEKYDEAEPLFRQSLAIRRALYDDTHPNVTMGLHNMGKVLYHQGQHDEAERHLREAMNLRTEGLGADHWHVAMTKSMLGLCLTAMDRPDEAEPLLAESYATLRDTHGPDDERTQEAQKRLEAATGAAE